MLRALISCSTALLFVTAAQAGDLNPPPGPVAPTMKTLDEVNPSTPINSLAGDAGAVHVIDMPGHYHLTDTILVTTSNMNAIRCDVAGVTIDLNGFTIVGLLPSTVAAIDAFFTTTIRNGVITNWSDLAVRTDGAVVIEDMHISSVGGTELSMVLGEGSIVRDCVFRLSEPLVLGSGTLVRDCVFEQMGDVIDSPDGDGISIIDCVMNGQNSTTNDRVIILGDDCIVRGVTVSDEGRGALFAGLRTLVSDCNFSGINNGTAPGIEVGTGSIIRDTSVFEYGGDGIRASFACTIDGCTIVSNDGDGVRATGNRNVIRNCNIASNSDDGIDVESNNRIEGNQIAFHSDHGIEVANSNHIVNNSLNGDPIEVNGDSNVIDSNNVAGTSGLFSVRLDGSHNRFSRNNIASSVFVLDGTNITFTIRNTSNFGSAGAWDNFLLGP